MNKAAKNGHLDVIQFLHENRTEGCTSDAMDHGAKIGRLDIVQFLDTHRHEGCTIKVMDQAAAGGHLDVVQHLHRHRTEGCTTRAMTQAGLKGYLDIVEFLHENRSEGCDPDEYCMTTHVPTLAYLHANQLVELDPEEFFSERLSLVHTALEIAIDWMDLDRIQFLDSKRPARDVFVSDAMDRAAASGNLDALKYFHTHGGHGGCTTAAMDDASFDFLEVVQFLQFNRSEGCTADALENAASRGRLDIVQFLCAYRPNESCIVQAVVHATDQDVFGFLSSQLPCPCHGCLEKSISL